jgi:N-acetylglucosaminyl-diphospho-decaprenol L-rhamnosyltransferase
MLLGIVIVNWNTRDYLHRCLTSVYGSRGEFTYKVVVVDNDSGDGSVEMVKAEFPQAELIAGHGNVGYPAGNNLGLRALGFADAPGQPNPDAPRYALLLNPDTELPPDALATMLRFMEAHPEAGVSGPKLVLENGSLDLACRRSFPTPEISFYRMIGLSRLFPKHRRFGRYDLTYLDENQTAEVDSVMGAFMLVRGEVIWQVGLLDESFFMYGEDLDWAKRIKDAGWKVLYYPQVEVLHVKRAASRQSRRAQIEFWRAMLIFYEKHYRAQTPWWLHAAIVTGIALKGGPKVWPYVLAGTAR